jgi:hypothetical protein
VAKWLTISETSSAIDVHLPEPPQVSTLVMAQIDRDRTEMSCSGEAFVVRVNSSSEISVVQCPMPDKLRHCQRV